MKFKVPCIIQENNEDLVFLHILITIGVINSRVRLLKCTIFRLIEDES